MTQTRLIRIAHFSAGHSYELAKPQGFGHNFKVEAHFQVLDDSAKTGSAERALKSAVDLVDHRYLNEALEFFKTNPASPENIARFMFGEIEKHVSEGEGLRLVKVRLFEGDTTWVDFFRDGLSETDRDF